MSSRWKPSVTVAAIIESEGRFLLVEEQMPGGLMLNNPAGHLDEGESPLEGVVRETLEETTRTFTPRSLVGVYVSRFQRENGDEIEDVTYLRFAYEGQVGEPDPTRQLDTGIVRTVWMTLDEIRASRERHRSPLVINCIEDYVAGKRHPLDLVTAHPSVYAPIVSR
jgi:8-oxo-dGTP pyrophosphatase MutT (NUDIX family)